MGDPTNSVTVRLPLPLNGADCYKSGSSYVCSVDSNALAAVRNERSSVEEIQARSHYQTVTIAEMDWYPRVGAFQRK